LLPTQVYSLNQQFNTISKMAFTLTDAQVAQYHKDGFLLIRAAEHGLVDVKDLQAWAKQVQSWPKEKGKWMPYDEINVNGERQLMRTEKFVDYHPEFDSFLRGEGLTKVLAQLSGAVSLLLVSIAVAAWAINDLPLCFHIGYLYFNSPCSFSKIKLTTKPPGKHSQTFFIRSFSFWSRGNGFAAHLDAPAYDHIGEIEHVTANLAVDSATSENGCLEVVPGSHTMDVSFLGGGKIHPDWEASHEWVTVPLEPGKKPCACSHAAFWT
jgi:hypothetical protein